MGIHTVRDSEQMENADHNAKPGDFIVIALRNSETREDTPESALLFEFLGRDDFGRLLIVLISAYSGEQFAMEEARARMQVACS